MSFIDKVVGLMNGTPEQETPADSTTAAPDTTTAPEQDAAAADGREAQEEAPTLPATQEALEQLLTDKKREWQEERETEEQERLRSLPETERLKQEQLSMDAKIAKLEAELTKRDLQAEIIAKLDERRLPVGIAELVQYGDRDSTMKSLDKLMGVFETAVQDGVMLRLRGKTPEGLGRAAGHENATRDAFARTFADAFKK